MQRAFDTHVVISDDPTITLVIDDHCLLFSRLARFLLDHEEGEAFRFASAHGELGVAIASRIGLGPADLDGPFLAVVGDRVLTRSEAAAVVARRLRRPWRWLALLRVLPRAWRDWCYDRIARNRYRFFGRAERSCFVMDARLRERILDVDAASVATRAP